MSHVLRKGLQGCPLASEGTADFPALAGRPKPPTGAKSSPWNRGESSSETLREKKRASPSGHVLLDRWLAAGVCSPQLWCRSCGTCARINLPQPRGQALPPTDPDADAPAGSRVALNGSAVARATRCDCQGSRLTRGWPLSPTRLVVLEVVIVALAGALADASEGRSSPAHSRGLGTRGGLRRHQDFIPEEWAGLLLTPACDSQHHPRGALAAVSAAASGSNGSRGAGCEFDLRPNWQEEWRGDSGAAYSHGDAFASRCKAALALVMLCLLLSMASGEPDRGRCLWQCLEPILFGSERGVFVEPPRSRPRVADRAGGCCHAHANSVRRLDVTARGHVNEAQRAECQLWAEQAGYTFARARAEADAHHTHGCVGALAEAAARILDRLAWCLCRCAPLRRSED